MRRWFAVLLSLLLLLQLTACVEQARSDPKPAQGTLHFYYCTRDYDPAEGMDQARTFGTKNGAMQWEAESFDAEEPDIGALLLRYLSGPRSEQLYCPIPLIKEELHWSLEDHVLQVEFGSAVQELTGARKTLAAACLVYTMTQVPQITSVFAPELSDAILKPTDFLLMDDTPFSDEREIRLYFRDETGRYLRPETIRHLFQENESEPSYVLRKLIEGPENPANRRVLPEDIRLFWCRVDDGICTVNFSEEFLNHMPRNHIEARTSVFAVVNTLTELPNIECVQFLCAGMRIESYSGLNLSVPLYREEPAILTPMEEQWFYDATLMVPCADYEHLLPVPTMISNTESGLLARNVLQALIDFRPMNGYESAIPEGTTIQNLRVRDGLCDIEFSRSFAMCDVSEKVAREAVYSVVNTLCRLENINRVKIQVTDEKLSSIDLSRELKTDPALEHP